MYVVWKIAYDRLTHVHCLRNYEDGTTTLKPTTAINSSHIDSLKEETSSDQMNQSTDSQEMNQSTNL